ncbi:MAG: SpoIIE family protein phosphatase [Planctomycetota bacterium]
MKQSSISRGKGSGEGERHSPPLTGQVKHRGLSLRTKFALFTALAITIAAIILVITAYQSVKQSVETEIDEGGIRLVKTLAAFDFNYWNDMQEKGKNPLAKIIGENANKMGIEIPTIINLLITNKQQESVIGINLVGVRLADSHMLYITPDGIEVEEGEYLENIIGSRIRTRSYKKTIISSEGLREGYILLFLSAKKIDEVLNKVFVSFLGPAVLAVIFGALVGFFIAGQVTKSLKILMSDMDIVSRGNLDHQSYAYSSDEIGILTLTFNRMTKSLKVAREKEIEAKALERELNIAQQIQTNLLPKKIPVITGYDIGTFYRPSREVGGDYYDLIQIDENNLGIIVADVSGKGIPGSMVMTMTRSLVRMESTRNLSPADTLRKINRILATDVRRGMFVTAMYLILNIKAKTILVSSAGHNPLVVWHQARHTYELINPNGIALGFDRGIVFEKTIKEQLIQLFPGDRFVLYTDGVIEEMNAHQEEFGSERFYKLVGQLTDHPSEVFIKQIVKILDGHKGAAPQHDDITLVSVKVTV